MKNKDKSLDIQEGVNLRICYNFLEGEKLPGEIRKQERYFELRKTKQEAQEFCNKFEKNLRKN